MRDGFKQVPIGRNHHCFGCGPVNPAGLHMDFFSDGRSVCSTVAVPPHLCGWNNLVHGGIIATLLDEIMSWTGIHLLKKITLTKSMTVEFIKPVSISHPLTLEGRIIEVTPKREARVEGVVLNAEGALCARGRSTLALLSPGQPRNWVSWTRRPSRISNRSWNPEG